MKILAVCGAGIGTSVVLKANLDKVLNRLEIDAEVQAVSINEANSPDVAAQVIFTTPEIRDHLTNQMAEIVEIENIFDLGELEFKVQASIG
jgi:PTS system ascorbate-specific IIB component